MYCKDCGGKIRSWQEYCQKCGGALYRKKGEAASVNHSPFTRFYNKFN